MKILQTLRKKRGLSVYELARLCGLSETTIKNAEKAGVNPTVCVLVKILKALKVSRREAARILYDELDLK